MHTSIKCKTQHPKVKSLHINEDHTFADHCQGCMQLPRKLSAIFPKVQEVTYKLYISRKIWNVSRGCRKLHTNSLEVAKYETSQVCINFMAVQKVKSLKRLYLHSQPSRMNTIIDVSSRILTSTTCHKLGKPKAYQQCIQQVVFYRNWKKNLWSQYWLWVTLKASCTLQSSVDYKLHKKANVHTF